MKIQDLTALKAVVKLCRSEGIESIEIDNIKLVLGAKAVKSRRKSNVSIPDLFDEANIKIPQFKPVVKEEEKEQEIKADIIKTDELTPEELLFYSASSQEMIDAE